MLASISGEPDESAGLMRGEEASGACPYGRSARVNRMNSFVSSIDWLASGGGKSLEARCQGGRAYMQA